MSWFTRKITDPLETFEHLQSPDTSVSQGAFDDFVANLNHFFVEFLCEKFEENKNQQLRLRILGIFAARHETLSLEDYQSILKLINYPDQVYREVFKEILQSVDEPRLKPLVNILCTTGDSGIRAIIQFAIEKSGIISKFLQKWSAYTPKEKILYLEEMVNLQNPQLYPIFIDILKEDSLEASREDKKIIQVEFSKHIEKIKGQTFLELCLKNMQSIDQSMRYSVFKCLQFHQDAFFSKLFDNFGKKSESYRLKIMQILEQIADPNSYKYLFPHLLDKAKSIPPVVTSTIQSIVKHFADELDGMTPEAIGTPEMREKIAMYVKPLEEHLSDTYVQASMILSECLLRIGRHHEETILKNLPKIHKYNESYLNGFLKGLDIEDRKNLLIKACCYKELETGRTALALLGNPTENFIIETLNSLLLEHFMEVPPQIQSEIINLMMDPRLKRFIEEVLYHNDASLRSRILQILAESGSPNALTVLVAKMRDPDFTVRKTILDLLTLKHFQSEAGTEVIINYLKDTEPKIVFQAIELLKDRDHPQILSALTKLLAVNDTRIKQTAHAAIAYITRRKFLTGFDKMPPEAKLAIGLSLIKMDPGFLEDMTRDLSSSDQRTRVLAAKVLEVLCEQIPPELKPNLIVAIQDPDPIVRSVVIMGLGKIGGPSVSQMLIGFLKDQDDRVRANAVEALSNVGELTDAEAIIPCLYDKNNRVRANTVITLWRLGYYQIYEPVLEMLRHPDKWMRASAAFALGEIKDARFMPVLIQCLRDPDADVRRNVIQSLGKISDAVSLAPYIKPLRFDPDEGVRRAVSDILAAAIKAKAKA
ncbi:HEAT repeat domain-containing protein [Candidatus Ozemobacteraceae bacterium]|nr:HEAT repeat domain-containing protein [Candidatus Ozemobacteraceae bacterium]